MKLIKFGTRISGEEPVITRTNDDRKIGERGIQTLKTAGKIGAIGYGLVILTVASAYRGYKKGLREFKIKHPSRRPPSFLEVAGILQNPDTPIVDQFGQRY